MLLAPKEYFVDPDLGGASYFLIPQDPYLGGASYFLIPRDPYLGGASYFPLRGGAGRGGLVSPPLSPQTPLSSKESKRTHTASPAV